MKLLYDENLPRSLVRSLARLFPDSTHVALEGLEAASDIEIWEFAEQGGFTIVSKDADFQEHSLLLGHPPKFVWIRRGNCSVKDLADLLTAAHPDLLVFEGDVSSLLVLE